MQWIPTAAPPGGAAGSVELDGHPADGGREDDLVVGEAGRFVRVVALHPGVVRAGQVRVGPGRLPGLSVELRHAGEQVLDQREDLSNYNTTVVRDIKTHITHKP